MHAWIIPKIWEGSSARPNPEAEIVGHGAGGRTAGQSRFQSLIPMYIEGADVLLIVYDITKRESFACARRRSIPGPLPWNQRMLRVYTQVSAGGHHTVLLRSDGAAVACGNNAFGRYDIIPLLDDGVTYTQVSAGGLHTVLLRSDGSAVSRGGNAFGQCDIPPLDEDVTYAQVSAGWYHTVLLRSDGSDVACGLNGGGQCDIPLLDDGLRYTQVSAGGHHTVLLRSDGAAVACGNNAFGRYDIIPLLDDGVTYTQVSAGGLYTVLLRSDGSAVSRGGNAFGQCDIPPLGDAIVLRCVGMDGEEVVRLRSRASDLAVDALMQLTHKLKACREQPRVVLPDGQLLDAVCSADPFVTLATVHVEHDKDDKPSGNAIA
eukprot:Skav227676  [mRNA]  locus=scaffold2108:9743:13700:- [translate_table: standard]